MSADARAWEADAGPTPAGPPPEECRTCGRDSCAGDCSGPVLLPFVKVADVARERVRWAWERRVPLAKVTILDGDPGLGKSTMLADVVARWTRGDSQPGEDHGRDALNVVILCTEDGIGDTIRPRLEVAGAELDRCFVVKGVPVFPPQLAELEATIRATAASVCILDPGLAYIDPELNSHADAEARRYLAGLAEVAERTATAIVFVRHLNKSGVGSPLTRGGGSIALIATARSGLLVATDPADPGRRLLAPTKHNLCAAPPTLAFRVVADGPHEPAHVLWEGESDVSASEALAAATDQRRADSAIRRSEVVDLLRSLLADGPVPAATVEQALIDAGIGGKDPLAAGPVRGARKALGIQSVKTGWNVWSWRLPERAL